MTIHSDHPFVPGPEERDLTRRFRGRLTAPVTVFTAGSGDRRVGLTVSSLFIVEGESPSLHAVVGPTSDLWDAIDETGRFVVHVCRERHTAMADVFAGLRPNPGGVFAGSETTESDWGPVLDELTDRAYCSLTSKEEIGWSGVVRGSIDQIEVTSLTDPLAYFRGKYRSLA